ncbi:hypothetical protein [uncultured Roseobacter sp.]|uniref:hypothetical protein n=1 Tax=uncultured Roseobacter sp. TaxID=114847 RepID=UPI00260D3F65|nr:hypothetical protein [uncultured Roseobacter sp.]
MITLLRLHHRRILVGTLFFGLAGFLQFHAVDDGVPLAFDFLITAIFIAIIAVLGFVGVALFPSFRVVMELGGIVFFITSVWQNTALSTLSRGVPEWLSTFSFFVLFAVLHHVLYGSWWQKSGLGVAARLRSRFKTRSTPAQVWARLVPDPNNLEAYYSGTLRGFDPVPDAPEQYIQKIGLGGSAVLELHVEVTEFALHRRYAYKFHARTSARNRDFNKGTCEITLTDLGGDGTLVEIYEINEKLAVGEALLMWFDHLGAQVSASARAVLEGSRDLTLLGKLRREVRALS